MSNWRGRSDGVREAGRPSEKTELSADEIRPTLAHTQNPEKATRKLLEIAGA